MTIGKESKFPSDSYIRGYCPYLERYSPKIEDDSLYLKHEDGSKHDMYAVTELCHQM